MAQICRIKTCKDCKQTYIIKYERGETDAKPCPHCADMVIVFEAEVDNE